MIFVGLIFDIILFIYDMSHGAVLHRVDKGIHLTDLMTSPKPENRKQIA